MTDPQPLSELVPPLVASLAERDLQEATRGSAGEPTEKESP